MKQGVCVSKYPFLRPAEPCFRLSGEPTPKAFPIPIYRMSPPQPTIATLATGAALEDLRIFLSTLELFNANPPTVFLYCDSLIARALPKFDYLGIIHTKEALDRYSAYDRRTMEAMPGKHFTTLWMDFMTEKINLLRWALETSDSVLLCDADICFTGPLPKIPGPARLALSPHMIIERDEKRFGKYNGGYAWFSRTEDADFWWNACATARYYEQSALEDLALHVMEDGPDSLYEFPKTHNYGWWRLWQGVKPPSELLKEWSMNRASGLCVEGHPLSSIHTHFDTRDPATKQFNSLILGWLKQLAQTHGPSRRLLSIVLC